MPGHNSKQRIWYMLANKNKKRKKKLYQTQTLLQQKFS